MDQSRLNFKLNFCFLKNLKHNSSFCMFFENPKQFNNFFYLPTDQNKFNTFENDTFENDTFENDTFNNFLLRRVVEVDNSEFLLKKNFFYKKIKCKKIFLKEKNIFVNLLYF